MVAVATSTVLRGSLRSAFNARSPAPSPQIRFGRWTPERPTVRRPVPANGGTVVARTAVVGFFALGLWQLANALASRPSPGSFSSDARTACWRGQWPAVPARKKRSLLVVVLASADGAAHGAHDPEDHADNDQDAADGLQDGNCRDQSDDHKHDSENDQLRFLPPCMNGPVQAWVK